MATIRGHFDGQSIVLDEPAALSVGQSVQIVIGPATASESTLPVRPSLVGFAKGMFEMRADFNDPLDEFAEYR